MNFKVTDTLEWENGSIDIAPETIYELGVYGYLLSAQEDALAPGGFLHSGQFILVDKEKRIRGIYEGTNAKEIDRMMGDTKILLAN